MKIENYIWKDNPTVSGISPCCTDTLNDCLMYLKYENKPNLCPKGTINSTPTGKLLSRMDNIVTISANIRTFATGEKQTIDETSFVVEPIKYKSILPVMTADNAPEGYTAYASSVYSSEYEAFRAYDKNSTSRCLGANNQYPYISMITIPRAKKPVFAKVRFFEADVPKKVSIFASNDNGATTETLYTLSEGLIGSMDYCFKLNIKESYTSFGLIITSNTASLNASVVELDFFEQDPKGDTYFDETLLIGIDGNNQPFATNSTYTQGILFPENAYEGHYHLINDPAIFGMWRYIGGVWTQDNGVAEVVFCGEASLRNGIIEEIKDFPLNANGYEFNNPNVIVALNMPDFSRKTNITALSSYTLTQDSMFYGYGSGTSQCYWNIYINGEELRIGGGTITSSFQIVTYDLPKGTVLNKVSGGVVTYIIPYKGGE